MKSYRAGFGLLIAGLAALSAGAPLAAADVSVPADSVLHAPARAREAVANPVPTHLDVGVISPGQVTTSLVLLPAELHGDGAGPIRYRIEPLSGTRIFGLLEGEIAFAGLADPVLPITYSVPRLQLSGPIVLANIEFATGTGDPWSVEIGADVISGYRLDLQVLTPNPEAEAGGTIDLRYSLVNFGNAPDSVTVTLEGDAIWNLDAPPGIAVIDPGQKHDALVRVHVPAGARPGDRLLLRLVARGRGAVVRSELLVSIAFRNLPTNYELPIRVFVGASGGSGRPGESAYGWALSGSGEVATGTTVSLSVRSRSSIVSRPAFATMLAGPALRASVRRTRWQLAAGEIFQGGDPVTGGQVRGRGASGSWRAGALSGSAVYAHTEPGAIHAGYVAAGGLAWLTSIGEVSVSMRSEAREAGRTATAGRLQGGVLTFATPDILGIRTDAGLGAIRVETAAGDVLKPVAHVDLSRFTNRGSLSFRARRSPTEADAFGARASELFAGGTLELGRGFSTTAWYAADQLASRVPGMPGGTTAASAGIRYGAGRFQSSLRGNYRSTKLPDVDSAAIRRRTVAVDVSAPLGTIFASLTAERGLAAGGPALDYLQGSLRQARGSNWTSLVGSYAAPLGIAPLIRLDLIESRSVGPVRVDLAAGGAPTGRWQQTLSAWAKAEMAIGRGLSMVLGAEYSPMAGPGSPIRLSMGLGHSLSIPLPTQREAAITGIAFHDLNGDGIRDPGEPGFAGLTFQQGSVSATTDRLGAFVLRGAPTGGALSVDPQSLLSGFVVPTNALRLVGRGMEIPVIRTAGLALSLFFDGDRDGVRGASEAPASQVVLSLTHNSGVRYTEAADDAGVIRFETLPPGSYVGLIEANEGLREARFEVHLEPGAWAELAVPVIRIEREIRFGPQSRAL